MSVFICDKDKLAVRDQFLAGFKSQTMLIFKITPPVNS